MQTPVERVMELVIESPAVFATLKASIDNGIFQGWAKAGGKEASLDQLRTFCTVNPEENLLRRFFRLLACFHVIEETGEDRWKPTQFSLQLGDPEGYGIQTILFGADHVMGPLGNLASYLAKTSYREPLDPESSNYMDVYGFDFFARCQSNQNYQKSFINGLMVGLTTHKVDWTNVYDTKALVDGYDSTMDAGVCLVDLGGAHGIDVSRFLAKHPELPAGSVVVQDLSDVIELAKVDPKIKTMAYDFFTPQPIRGSRAYFTHAVLHDWNDKDTRKILDNVVRAMKKGYSKLLLYESVVPPTKANAFQAAMDLALMYVVSAAERSEAVWQQLLAEAGLKVLKIWKNPAAYENIIEAELA
jgi:hypothetical protein